jgi:hypothetical protein
MLRLLLVLFLFIGNIPMLLNVLRLQAHPGGLPVKNEAGPFDSVVSSSSASTSSTRCACGCVCCCPQQLCSCDIQSLHCTHHATNSHPHKHHRKGLQDRVGSKGADILWG